jgi:predicted nucleotidyltransferase component of viral defense system
MALNIKSLHARLLNIAREQGIEFQLLIHRWGAEQFLYRLSKSPYKDKFVFKGGTLLSYLIDSDRKTRDLDFSIKHLKNRGEELPQVIQSILEVPVDDGIVWDKVKHSPLNHPEMAHPGIRIVCDFLLGEMRGQIRMDLAIEDVVTAAKIPLKRIRYKDVPLIGEDFELQAYPPEAIFSEKLQIAIKRGALNTRMKDYYDLFKLCSSNISKKKVKECIRDTFGHRNMEVPTKMAFDKSAMTKLQEMWSHYIRKQNLKDAPTEIGEIIDKINELLRGVE